MQKKITTILFDLDGTLIDTNELIVDSFLHTLGNYFPGEYKREDVFQFMGPSLQDTFTQLNPSKVDEMIAAYREHNHKRHDELVTIFPGVHETVETLYEQGYKLAIVSTKLSDTVHKGLKLTKLDRFFDVIVGFDHVTHAKPDPEPLLKALKQLDSTPEEAIMVGDNYHDILGGKNTGTLTCGVAWSLKGKEHLATFEPDYMLENMRDLLNILGVKENAKN